ncbi:MAG: hypothetical protein ABI120_12730 [Gemmatimonadaceae bacterium]
MLSKLVRVRDDLLSGKIVNRSTAVGRTTGLFGLFGQRGPDEEI